MRTCARWFGVGAVALIAVALTGCLPDPPVPYWGNSSGRRVGVMGDSIMWAIGPALSDRLTPTYYVSTKIEIGPTIAQRMPTTQGYAAAQPAVMVVELGQNDNTWITTGATPPTPEEIATSVAQTGADLGTSLGLFVPNTCFALVDLNTHTGYPPIDAWSQQWDATVIPAVVARDPRVRVVHWDAYVAAYLAAGQPDGPLTHDGIHPAGTDALRIAPRLAPAWAVTSPRS